jgi:predicted transcriptional regulator
LSKRRDKLQIYYDILSAIKNENTIYVSIKPTRLQYESNLSYSKLMSYIEELMLKGFIVNKQDKILISEKGYAFITNYSRLLDLIKNTDLI